MLVSVIGALLCQGRRTVAAALQVMGLGPERLFDRYHRVLSRARWLGLRLHPGPAGGAHEAIAPGMMALARVPKRIVLHPSIKVTFEEVHRRIRNTSPLSAAMLKTIRAKNRTSCCPSSKSNRIATPLSALNTGDANA